MNTLQQIASLCKSRGIIYPGSDIYGGLANTWDYGPIGVELKNNIKKAWWTYFVQAHNNIVGLDASILMNPKTWEASGHLAGFSDPLIDCRECKNRFRADHLIEDYAKKNDLTLKIEAMDDQEMLDFLKEHSVNCPVCGKNNYTDIRKFNLMFKTFQGVTENSTTEIYLRPETAQAIFVDFKLITRTVRQQVPFGVAQIGKSFRNEITPGNFIFRTREFEQMELEFFCHPDEADDQYVYWKDYCWNFLKEIGLKEENLRLREHEKEELSHYSAGTSDIEYLFDFGWGELWGIANRTNFDLTRHMEVSSQDLRYQDPITNEKYIPYVIEPSVGVERLLLAVLFDTFEEEQLEDGTTRNIFHFHPMIAPIKVGILPLSKKLTDKAQEVFNELAKNMRCELDEKGNIGKRYRRFDEIGTPYCVTIDFDTLEDEMVTVRERDSMEQHRIPIAELEQYLLDRLKY